MMAAMAGRTTGSASSVGSAARGQSGDGVGDPHLVVAHLHDRHDPVVDVDVVARERQGLDVTDHLLGRLAGRGEDVHLGGDRVRAGDHAGRLDTLDASQSVLELGQQAQGGHERRYSSAWCGSGARVLSPDPRRAGADGPPPGCSVARAPGLRRAGADRPPPGDRVRRCRRTVRRRQPVRRLPPRAWPRRPRRPPGPPGGPRRSPRGPPGARSARGRPPLGPRRAARTSAGSRSPQGGRRRRRRRPAPRRTEPWQGRPARR